MTITVFYLWQSDQPVSTNKYFIQEAIQLAISNISGDATLDVEVSLDRDTQNEPGSPAIADLILQKISHSGLFLGDVTIVANTPGGKSTPNPNILLELGYAAARLGWERIICVMNTQYGSPKKLPFDIRHRRWPLQYRLAKEQLADEVMLQALKEELARDVEQAIRTAIQSGIVLHTVNPKDQRVAIQFEGVLNHLLVTLGILVQQTGAEYPGALFMEDHDDEPGSQYPAPDFVAPILSVLAATNFNHQSHVTLGGVTLTWREALVHDLRQTMHNCGRILDRYAGIFSMPPSAARPTWQTVHLTV